MSNQPEAEREVPVFKKWSGWYWLVISVMLIQVLVYLWITLSFS